MAMVCLYCGGELPQGRKPRTFCCDRCRRKYQDARRKEERAEERLLKAELARPFSDPWQRHDLDDYTREMICQNACLDPAPVLGPDRAETMAKRSWRERQPGQERKAVKQKKRPARKVGNWLSLLDPPEEEDKKPQGRGWKKNWLSLC